ncbi:MAG TPA: HU family DNA-binding protein [Pirellulaceae bacterium]|nr:HU family DNA-binding protein [Pirellulaceae bacterium]
MTRKLIAKMLAEQLDLSHGDALALVQAMFQAITETLVIEKRIEIRNFGVFHIKRRKPRRARNLSANQEVKIPARYVVRFKAGKELSARVDQLFDEEHRWQHLSEKRPKKPRRDSKAD